MPVDVCEVWTVDRIEEVIAIVEDCGARVTELPVSFLPSGTREGDRILLRRLPAPASSGGRGRRLRMVRGGPEAPVEAGPWAAPPSPTGGRSARTEK